MPMKNRRKNRRGMVPAVGLAILGMASVATAGPAQAATSGWRVVKTFDYAKYDAVHGVTAISAKNAWAFTGTDDARADKSRPVAQHWNGTKWAATALPSGLHGQLFAGDYSSASNVWAVGGADGAAPYVLRWNGRTWSLAKKWASGQVTGVTVISTKDVWVFGAPGADHGVGTWHYDGKSWSQVTAPFIPAIGSKLSGSDIWATGRGLNGDSRTIGHWDGAQWKVAPTGDLLPPDLQQGDGKPWRDVFLNGVLARSAKDVWVSGVISSGNGNGASSEKPVLIHWNGRSWTKAAAPSTGNLIGVTSDGSGGLWFTGWTGDSMRGVLRHRTAAGRWTTAKVAGVGKKITLVWDLTLVPGTHRLLGGGYLRPADQSGSDGAIFAYGR